MARELGTPTWQRVLLKAWQQRGWVARLLWPLSWLYRLLFWLRGGLYRYGLISAARLPVPVLVVGNVVAGGAGKTPVVIEVVKHFSSRGLNVGVIARGYGRRGDACEEVTSASQARDVGDEPVLIHARTGCPVVVSAARAQAVRHLLARHPQTDLVVSDDGLQHLSLHRDLEVVVFDARGVGNGWLLPAGPLREPWPRPVDLAVSSGDWPLLGAFKARRSLSLMAKTRDGQPVDLIKAQQAQTPRPILAVAAIAQPEVFFDMLRSGGLTLKQTIALADHDSFSAWSTQRTAGYTVICTEKDAVKLWAIDPNALAVPLIYDLPTAFFDKTEELLRTRCAGHPLATKLSSSHGHQTT